MLGPGRNGGYRSTRELTEHTYIRTFAIRPKNDHYFRTDLLQDNSLAWLRELVRKSNCYISKGLIQQYYLVAFLMMTISSYNCCAASLIFWSYWKASLVQAHHLLKWYMQWTAEMASYLCFVKIFLIRVCLLFPQWCMLNRTKRTSLSCETVQ